jgi:hypothetical protein
MSAGTPSALVPPEHECHTEAEQTSRPAHRGWFGAVRDAVVAFVGALLAIAPHVMHHIGLIAGAAFLTGAGGNALFYVLGLVFSVPMLRRLHRRFRTWRAPAIAIAVFTAVFSLSAFVIGPAISGESTPTEAPSTPTDTPSQNVDHHGH